MSEYKILCIWPPTVPTYFNAGHHLPLWEVGNFLRAEVEYARVDIVDAGVLNYTWKETADLLLQDYNLICIVNEYDNVEGVRRLVEYTRAISPNSKIITFGRVSGVIPSYFCDAGLDAVVKDGDFEAAVLDYIAYLQEEKTVNELAGLIIKTDNGWESTPPGRFLEAQDWAYPPVEELPFNDYARLSSRPENRFSALPGKRELTVAVARGCPMGCDYCLVPMYQGLRERRRSVESVIAHIEYAKARVEFDYISMYAPTFTLSKTWTFEFCDEIKRLRVPWKCCTTIAHLNEKMVTAMGGSGCVRISVGLETLDMSAQTSLPKIKQIKDPQLENLAIWCREVNIELNCFVMVGMPNQTAEGLRHTFDYIEHIGAKVRPTIYTPYQGLNASVAETELSAFFTRQLSKGVTMEGLTSEEFYSLELTAEMNS